MKALFINEILNFNKTGDPLDKMNIGKGPEKYIPIFEKILNLCDIKFKLDEQENREGLTKWDIYEIHSNNIYSVYLIQPGYYKNPAWMGWNASEFANGYLKNPFTILESIIEMKWGNIDEQIEEIKIQKEEIDRKYTYFTDMKFPINEAKEIIKKYT
ncbi:MAG: hypothetical protein PHF86_00650 [Candidatus Nanoarchaeia archaeon]|nr:hypothetical protein [Candidatus Nanoarchaeia archaeon]